MAISWSGLYLDQNYPCGLCFNYVNPGQVAVTHPDSRIMHIFHEACLLRWLTEHVGCSLCQIAADFHSQIPAAGDPSEYEDVAAAHVRNTDDEDDIMEAAARGELEPVLDFLADGVSYEDRVIAVRLALQNRHFLVAQALLANGFILSDDNRYTLLENAAQDGNIEALGMLTRGVQLPETTVQSIIGSAENAGHGTAVRAFFYPTCHEPVSRKRPRFE